MACALCRAPKDVDACESCGSRVCKNCVALLGPDRIEFYPAPPPALLRRAYCVDCFEREAAPLLEKYDLARSAADEVTLVAKAYRGEVPTLARAKGVTEVADHVDSRDAIRHLQFLAAWEGYDAVLGVESSARKLRNHGYETRRWSARGTFAKLDHGRFDSSSEADPEDL